MYKRLLFFVFSFVWMYSHAGHPQKIDSLPGQWNFQDSTVFTADPEMNYQSQHLLDDALLNSLIDKAIKNNSDVLIALNRVDKAKSLWRSQQSGYYPEISLNGAYAPQQTSASITGLPQTTVRPLTASLDMSWEIDIIGSVRGKAHAQRENYYASREEFNSIMVMLCTQVSSTYVNLRTAQTQLEVAQRNLASQDTVLQITEARYKSGLASQLDVAQAKTVYNSTLAMLPQLGANVAQLINALGVLCGEYPWNMRELLSEVKPLPTSSTTILVGLPGSLIRQRPDVLSAEHLVESKAASLGASRADFWPKFYLNGSIGYGSKDFETFTNQENMTWQIAPSVRWTIFSGARNYQVNKYARTDLDESINSYNYTVLNALQEVDNSMTLYSSSIKETEAKTLAYEQAKLTLDLALTLYKQGLIDFQNVLDAQRSLLSYESQMVESQGNNLQYLIQFYRAIGGKWNN